MTENRCSSYCWRDHRKCTRPNLCHAKEGVLLDACPFEKSSKEIQVIRRCGIIILIDSTYQLIYASCSARGGSTNFEWLNHTRVRVPNKLCEHEPELGKITGLEDLRKSMSALALIPNDWGVYRKEDLIRSCNLIPLPIRSELATMTPEAIAELKCKRRGRQHFQLRLIPNKFHLSQKKIPARFSVHWPIAPKLRRRGQFHSLPSPIPSRR
jgi:hypothetical protein